MCISANEEHGRELPMMNGIKEDIKFIGVLDSVICSEALYSLASRFISLKGMCKAHFEEEEKELLPMVDAAEMGKEKQKKLLNQSFEVMRETHSPTRVSVILCATIYSATGLFCYLLFGDSTMTDVLMNFDQTSSSSIGSLVNNIVRLSYAIHLMLVFPLLNFFKSLLFPKKPSLVKDNKRFFGLTFPLMVTCFLAAIAIPDIWYFFQFLGSTSTVSIAFIFPAAIVLRNVNGISTLREKIVASVMLALAVATSIIAISTNIYTFTTTEET